MPHQKHTQLLNELFQQQKCEFLLFAHILYSFVSYINKRKNTQDVVGILKGQLHYSCEFG